jgi:hypothetical protein
MYSMTRRQFAAPVLFAPQFGKIFEGLGGKRGPLSDSRIGDGLKEALRISTGNAVSSTGRKDGFFANEAIRILLPEPIRKAEKVMRFAGMGAKLDELALGMNRAAEAAAPAAKDIFLDAIKAMTFSDVKGLLNGGDNAATSFFRDKTSPRLTELFRPPVTQVMSEVGVTKLWAQTGGSIMKLIPGKGNAVDLDGYVVGKTLEGLFHVMGQEEAKIRRDPAAQVTSLLKEVFGKR